MKLKTVNLIPREALKKPFPRQLKELYRKNVFLRKFGILILVFILLGLSQILSVAVFSCSIERSKLNLQNSKVKLNKLQAEYLQQEKKKSALVKEESQAKQKLDFLLSNSSRDKRFSKLLISISELTPQDLWINQVSFGEDEIRIIGSTLNNQLINQFIGKLDESKSFRNSRFTSSEKQVANSHTIYNFQISTEPLWTGESSGSVPR